MTAFQDPPIEKYLQRHAVLYFSVGSEWAILHYCGGGRIQVSSQKRVLGKESGLST